MKECLFLFCVVVFSFFAFIILFILAVVYTPFMFGTLFVLSMSADY